VKWKERIKTGDLVRFDASMRANSESERYPHLFEIGLVIDTQGLDPIVSFPSKTQNCAVSKLEVM
jgi:hypothetical protein